MRPGLDGLDLLLLLAILAVIALLGPIERAALRPLLCDFDPEYHDDYYGGLIEYMFGDLDVLPLPLLRALVNVRRRWTRADGSLVDIPAAEAVAA